jgi:hypothetical protein
MRPLLLKPVEMKKSWGSELWLNATLPEASADTADGTLAELLAARPELLGEWTRRLFGEQLPIFTKFLHAYFPPFVHVGFSRAVERATLLGWLAREQAGLRQLYTMLQIHSREAFDAFSRIYSAWAIRQASEHWQIIDQDAFAADLRPFTAKSERLVTTLAQLRQNRAQLVDVLNEVDLRREADNLLLTPAGVVHSIFGLSHQTHPLDRMRTTLQSVFRNLRRLAASGLGDEDLASMLDGVDLPELRKTKAAPPKNEAWLPAFIDGQLMLVEPQQTSDTTYSLADFYTPFVWDGARMRFRKGEATFGIASNDLARQVEDVELSATSIDQIRRVPTRVASLSKHDAILFRLVDEPDVWPFFTAYQVTLENGRWQDRPKGVFQQLVVLSGEADLIDSHGLVGTLNPTVPAFIPATLDGDYQLAGSGKVLIFSVPGLRGGYPHA